MSALIFVYFFFFVLQSLFYYAIINITFWVNMKIKDI